MEMIEFKTGILRDHGFGHSPWRWEILSPMSGTMKNHEFNMK